MSANLDHDVVPPVQETIHYGHFTLSPNTCNPRVINPRRNGVVRGAKLLITTVIHGETLNRPAVQPVGDLWAMELLCGGPDSPPLPSAPTKTVRPTNDNITLQILLKVGKSGFRWGNL